MSGRVVVIGGGISGLTTAFWLRRAGVPVIVLERASCVGGTMRTARHEGWLVETGPNSALETTPLLGEMFDLLGVTDRRLYAEAAAKNRYILRSGRLHALPLSPAAFLATGLWPLSAKLRVLGEPFIGRASREESVAEFVERRLGREFLDYAINPFVAGVYAGNPETLSVRAAFPKLYALEERYGGLVRGMIGGVRERRRRAEKAKDRARMFSFAGGMQEFPEALGRFLGDAIRTGADVVSIAQTSSPEGPGWVVRYRAEGAEAELDAGAVVLSTPAHDAAGILRAIDPAVSDTLESITYPPVAEVFLGFRETQIPRPLDGFGYLVPAREQRRILGTIWSSAIFPHRAPAGHAALTTFVGGARQPEIVSLDDDALSALVLAEVRAIMGVRGDPVFTSVARWDRAIPQYTMGYDRVLAAFDRLEQQAGGLFLCSNYRGGIAVGDCVMSGHRTAARVRAYLGVNVSQSKVHA